MLSLGAVFVVRSFGSESGADGFLGGKVVRRPDPDQAEHHARDAALSWRRRPSRSPPRAARTAPCLQFTISAAPSATVAQDLASGTDNRPDLWVPDSSLWVAQADDGETVPTIAVPSIAMSPLVLVGRNENFADTSSWLGAFAGDRAGPARPVGQQIAGRARAARDPGRAGQDLGVERARSPGDRSARAAARLDGQAVHGPRRRCSAGRAQEGSTVVVPASEQTFVKYQDEHPERRTEGDRAAPPAR